MQLYTVGAGILGTAGAIYLAYNYFGRRTIVLIGTGAAALSMLASAIGGTVATGTNAAAMNFVAWSVIFSVVYGGFAAMVTWTISAEVVSSELRVSTLSFATGIDYAFACKSRL